MPIGLDELKKDENVMQEWIDRVFKFLNEKQDTSTPAFNEYEIVLHMNSEYNPHDIRIHEYKKEEENIRKYVRAALTKLVTEGMVITKKHDDVRYYWVESKSLPETGI